MSDYDPIMKTILHNYQMINDQAGYIFASDWEKIERISKALDSNISQIRRAAAHIIVGIIEFDSDYADFIDFCWVIKKALTSKDKVVMELVFNAIIDSNCGVPNENIIDILKEMLSNPSVFIRLAVINALDSAIYESARFEYEDVIENIVYIFEKCTKDNNPKIRKAATHSLMNAYEEAQENELENSLKIIDEILNRVSQNSDKNIS